MQKIVTLDGFWVRTDPRDHFVNNATLTLEPYLKILAGQLIVKLLQTFEVVRGPHGPRISILGLMGHLWEVITCCRTHVNIVADPSEESPAFFPGEGSGLCKPARTEDTEINRTTSRKSYGSRKVNFNDHDR